MIMIGKADRLLGWCRTKSKEPMPLMGETSVPPYGAVGQPGNSTMNDCIVVMVDTNGMISRLGECSVCLIINLSWRYKFPSHGYGTLSKIPEPPSTLEIVVVPMGKFSCKLISGDPSTISNAEVSNKPS
jgi:hypothetical protein